MKLAILFLFSIVFFLQCEQSSNKNTEANGQNINAPISVNSNGQNIKMEGEVFNYNGKEGELECQFKGTIQKKGNYNGINQLTDSLAIEYSIKNTGQKEYFVFNQGHSNKADKDIVYVEPIADGLIELSQKAFSEPLDKMCPSLYVAIMPRASVLKAGETLKNKVLVEFPLKRSFPYDSCTPVSEMPANSNKVRFCIGYAEKDKTASISKEGYPNPNTAKEKQKLLCSEIFEIK